MARSPRTGPFQPRGRGQASRPPHDTRCPITGKPSYRNRRSAIAGRSRVIADWDRVGTVTRGELYPYRCPDDRCGRWHLSHIHPDEYRPRRPRRAEADT